VWAAENGKEVFAIVTDSGFPWFAGARTAKPTPSPTVSTGA
jgi:hypothetical protein